MAKMDWGMEEEAQRLSGRLPSEGGGGGGGGAPAPAPSAARRAGEQSGAFARNAGKNLRAGLIAGGNAALGEVERQVNTNPVVALTRGAANATNQFKAGFTGQPSAPEVQPLSLPRIRDRGASVDMVPAGGPNRPPKVRGGAPMAQSFDRSRPMPAAPAPAPTAAAAPAPTTRADGITVTQDANGNNVYTGVGTPDTYAAPTGPAPLTRAAAQAAGSAPVMPPMDLQGDTVTRTLAGQRALTRQTRADAAALLNPASQEAELLRRAENAAGSFFLKGRPGARNATVGALLGQLQAGNDASAAGQEAGNAALQGGQNAVARGALAAQQGLIDDKLKRTEIDGETALESMRLNAPTREVGADGIVRTVRGDTASPVLDEAGQPLRAPQPARSGAITPQDLLKSYNERFKAIQEAPIDPEARAQQLAALQADPMFQAILGQQQGPQTAVNDAGERVIFNPATNAWEPL